MRLIKNIISCGVLLLFVACASMAFKAGETTVADVEKQWGSPDKIIPIADGNKEYYWVVDRHTNISGASESSVKPTITWRVMVFDASGHFQREAGVRSE
jgi:hypothetical protein